MIESLDLQTIASSQVNKNKKKGNKIASLVSLLSKLLCASHRIAFDESNTGNEILLLLCKNLLHALTTLFKNMQNSVGSANLMNFLVDELSLAIITWIEAPRPKSFGRFTLGRNSLLFSDQMNSLALF